MKSVSQFSTHLVLLTLFICISILQGDPCTQPDNGTGTATLPPIGCEYTSPDEVFLIIEGLPPGTTLEMAGILKDFVCNNPPTCSLPLLPGECETAGGGLGGDGHCFEATLELDVTGTGSLAGYHRMLFVPVMGEVHTGPRNPGDPVQSFAADFYVLTGELFGDPDFCTFRLTAGTNYGLPSPGQTTLTELPGGDFNVDSFFDITYEIEFEGCPGSPLDGYMGITTATIRMETGEPASTQCEPLPDGSGCTNVVCQNPQSFCQPVCANYDPMTGISVVTECECRPEGACHLEPGDGIIASCVLPDNGTGTPDLPPVGCEYYSPDEVFQLIDGLPPGTTIELDGPLTGITCPAQSPPCSIMMPNGVCEGPGGSLGGNIQCFEASLDLDVTGTGDLAGFNRHIYVPIVCEVHTGPRNPGNPVQTFQADFYRMQGELFGDPDFCTFRIRGGSNFGLPSPGQTTLTELPSGDFAVDSFFDITYQIEFEGCPGSPLDGFTGITTAVIRVEIPIDFSIPTCIGDCPAGYTCYESVQENPDGTFDICCNCVPLITSATDFYATPEAQVDLADDPLPPDFFGPGSDPFDGIITFKGKKVQSTSLYDTRILRDDILLTDPPISVPIELVELNLKSVEPIRVTYFGGTVESFFDVTYDVNPTQPSTGWLTPDGTPSGGLYDMHLDVYPRLQFDKVGGSGSATYQPANPIQLDGLQYPWQDMPLAVVRPPCEGPGFFPSGVDPLHMSDLSGTTYHDITPRDPLPMDFNEDGVVDLADLARFGRRWLDIE